MDNPPPPPPKPKTRPKPWVMRIPCGTCGRTGSESVPVFFIWPPADTVRKKIPEWMYNWKVGYVPVYLLVPIDEVTPERRAEITRILGLETPCEVRCTACIAAGASAPWKREHIHQRLRGLVEECLHSYVVPLKELIARLTPTEREALHQVMKAAYEEGLQEAMRRDSRNLVRVKGEPQKPEPLHGRHRPPRDKLRQCARLLDLALRRHHLGTGSKRQRSRRLLPLLLNLNMYLSLGRVKGRLYHLPPDDPRLLERVRKML